MFLKVGSCRSESAFPSLPTSGPRYSSAHLPKFLPNHNFNRTEVEMTKYIGNSYTDCVTTVQHFGI